MISALTGLHENSAFAFLQPAVLSESLVFYGNAQINLYTSSSHNMISKPIKLTAFQPKFAVLNQSITLTSCRGQEK